jgi:hypothetical protein
MSRIADWLVLVTGSNRGLGAGPRGFAVAFRVRTFRRGGPPQVRYPEPARTDESPQRPRDLARRDGGRPSPPGRRGQASA